MALFLRFLFSICFLTLFTFMLKTYTSYWDRTLLAAPVIHQILETPTVHMIPLTLTSTCNVCLSSVLKTNSRKIRLRRRKEIRRENRKQKREKNQKLIENLQGKKGEKKGFFREVVCEKRKMGLRFNYFSSLAFAVALCLFVVFLFVFFQQRTLSLVVVLRTVLVQ